MPLTLRVRKLRPGWSSEGTKVPARPPRGVSSPALHGLLLFSPNCPAAPPRGAGAWALDHRGGWCASSVCKRKARAFGPGPRLCAAGKDLDDPGHSPAWHLGLLPVKKEAEPSGTQILFISDLQKLSKPLGSCSHLPRDIALSIPGRRSWCLWQTKGFRHLRREIALSPSAGRADNTL